MRSAYVRVGIREAIDDGVGMLCELRCVEPGEYTERGHAHVRVGVRQAAGHRRAVRHQHRELELAEHAHRREAHLRVKAMW